MIGCGILKKIINIIKDVYNGFTHDEFINIWAHGCIISPYLFLSCIDWMMRRVSVEPWRILWTLTSSVEDVHFAMTSVYWATGDNRYWKIRKFKEEGGKIGLKIKGRPRLREPTNRDGENLEEVKTFCYLESVVNRNVDVKEEVKLGK